MALRRFCFNIPCITFGPAFDFSNFDVAGCLGFAFDAFKSSAFAYVREVSCDQFWIYSILGVSVC